MDNIDRLYPRTCSIDTLKQSPSCEYAMISDDTMRSWFVFIHFPSILQMPNGFDWLVN